LADQPSYTAALLGLAELCLVQDRGQELEELIGRLESSPEGAGFARLVPVEGDREAYVERFVTGTV
jgi:hypothetical protein